MASVFADDEGVWPKVVHRFHDAAALVEQPLALIGDDDLRRCASAQVVDDEVRQPVHVDDCFRDAGLAESVERMVDQRAPATLTSGLGSVFVIGRMRVPSPAANTIAVRGARAPAERQPTCA